MRVFGPDFTPTTLSVDAFVGQYTWYDDGWAGILSLSTEGVSGLSGKYTSLRFGTVHRVSADVGGPLSHEIALDIHDFNGLAAQRFTGYLATESRALIAGVTRWRDECYGFYATREAPTPLAAFRVGQVEPADFAGQYTLRVDGGPAQVELVHDGERGIHGTVRHRDDAALPISGDVDPDDPLLVRLTVRSSGNATVLSARMFSRPKNVLAGWVDTPAARVPCYLVRIG